MAQAIPMGYGSQCQGGAGVRRFSRSGKPMLLLSLIPVGRYFPTQPRFFSVRFELGLIMNPCQTLWPFICCIPNCYLQLFHNCTCMTKQRLPQQLLTKFNNSHYISITTAITVAPHKPNCKYRSSTKAITSRSSLHLQPLHLEVPYI